VHDCGRRDIQFCLVGEHDAVPVEALAQSSGVSDFVTLTGRIGDHDLFEILSTADVCVNPDRVNAMNDKSTMNKILEYMAFSKAMVQFEVTEGRYSAGAASLYASPNDPTDFGDKILELVDDPSRRCGMGELGRQRVEREFSWAHQVEPLLQAYERLFASLDR
jgi:glycosyltransferase involved in cell wall biosynthesis